ncbi:MAG: hypothetical protein ACJ754_11685 [Pyrinomonadaceae bacterium]
MPDIQTLTSLVQQLERTHSFWSTWSVYFIAATFWLRACIFFAQWMTNKRGNALGEAQAALIRAKDEQIRTHNEQVASELKDKDVHIADAEKKAAEAKAETVRVENEGKKELARVEGEAGTKIEAARAEAAKEVGKVQTDLETQRERAAKAELALLELQERTKPRTLTPEQRTRLVEALKQYAHKHNEQRRQTLLWVKVRYVIGNAESEQFALQLIEVFRGAGWVIFTERGSPAPLAFSGLQTRVTLADGATAEILNERSEMEGAVRKAFTDVGFEVWGVASGSDEGSIFTVDVGTKP